MPVEIITVKRPHRWIVRRGVDPRDAVCDVCGKSRRQVSSAACYEEEIEREVPDAS